MQETEPHGITPVQYAALHAVSVAPGIDQRTLARTIGLDASTIGGVIDRLEARGLIERSANAEDRRVKLLSLTSSGKSLLRAATPAMLRAQQRMLEPLDPDQRKAFMRMLDTLVATNNAQSRAPSES